MPKLPFVYFVEAAWAAHTITAYISLSEKLTLKNIPENIPLCKNLGKSEVESRRHNDYIRVS